MIIKVKAVKDSSVRFRIPEWKRTELKRIADENETTMSALFQEWVNEKLSEAGVKLEVTVKSVNREAIIEK